MEVFVTSANKMYGSITTLRANNCLIKHIPWSAFKLIDIGWLMHVISSGWVSLVLNLNKN